MAAMLRRWVLGGMAAAALPRLTRAQRATTPTPRPQPAPNVSRGAHDLTGVWTNAWYTHLQRPGDLKTVVLTPAQAQAYEAPRRAHAGEVFDEEHDELGQAMTEFPENGPGLARIHGEIRAAWIVDPPDGRVPWRPEVKKRLRPGDDSEDFDNVEARQTDERCLLDSGTGAPILNSHDGNLVTFVLTAAAGRAGWLAIAGEKDHGLRIVRIAGAGPHGAAPAPPAAAEQPDPPGWMGASLGHWEGATLVVETTGLRPGVTKVADDLYLSDRTRVTERFTRSGPAEIAYGFEVADETLFTRPWRGEMVFRPAEGAMYEYACHEGNYGLPNILAGARAREREAAKGGR